MEVNDRSFTTATIWHWRWNAFHWFWMETLYENCQLYGTE